MEQDTPLFELHDKQFEALELLGLGDAPPQVDELLFGGQAGGGKSMAMRVGATAACMKWPGAVMPIFRRTYPELEESQIREMLKEIPESLAKYNGERHELMFKNGSIVEFRHCDLETQVFRYFSAEWAGLMIDEATQFTPLQISVLRSRVRRPVKAGEDWHPVILYGTNPGGIGHQYFKDGFVDAAPEGTVFQAPKSDGSLRRCFLRSRLSDNPSLSKEEYEKVLEGISDPEVRRAVASGDWDVYSGQFFTEFRRDLHVCEPFEVPEEWVRWTGQDWGISKPACCLWFARVPPNIVIPTLGGPTRSETPRTIVYREWYHSGYASEDQALSFLVISREDPPLYWRYADPHMWDKADYGGSEAEVFDEAGWTLSRANNDRKAGWDRVRHMLKGDDLHPPEIVIMKNCTNLIRTLPALPRDRIKPEDVDTLSEDHAADAFRYGLMGGSRLTKAMKSRPRASYAITAAEKRPSGDSQSLWEELTGVRQKVAYLPLARRN